ncbi:hypothetical protein [Roseibium sediminis]|uniref:hypothetical protein n=1 Tax=Roseibium sediminis TaxID=1775174 RepID=UPI00123E157D|nr:hypothetical protein [Roseibium sediminis]
MNMNFKPGAHEVFNLRLKYWVAEGKRGQALYNALSTDPNLPHLLNEGEASQILGLSVRALRMRRFRKQPPYYRKLGKAVRYTTEDLCNFLADGLIEG